MEEIKVSAIYITKGILKRVFSVQGLMGYLSLLAFIISLKYLFFTFMPHSCWLKYDSIESKFPKYSTESRAIFISRTTYGKGRGIDIEWNDILRCTVDGQTEQVGEDGPFAYYSNYVSSLDNWQPKDSGPFSETEWVYGGRTPTRPSTCYLDSRITYEFPMGIEKHQSVTSNFFRFE